MISDRKKKETNTSSYSIISIDKEIENDKIRIKRKFLFENKIRFKDRSHCYTDISSISNKSSTASFDERYAYSAINNNYPQINSEINKNESSTTTKIEDNILFRQQVDVPIEDDYYNMVSSNRMDDTSSKKANYTTQCNLQPTNKRSFLNVIQNGKVMSLFLDNNYDEYSSVSLYDEELSQIDNNGKFKVMESNFKSLKDVQKINNNIKKINLLKLIKLNCKAFFHLFTFIYDNYDNFILSHILIQKKLNFVLNNKYSYIINSFKKEYGNYLHLEEIQLFPKQNSSSKFDNFEMAIKCRILPYQKVFELSNKNITDISYELSYSYEINNNQYIQIYKFDVFKEKKSPIWLASETEEFKYKRKRLVYSSTVQRYSWNDYIKIRINLIEQGNKEVTNVKWNPIKLEKPEHSLYEKKEAKTDIIYDPVRACEIESLVHIWKGENQFVQSNPTYGQIKKIFEKNFEFIETKYDIMNYIYFKFKMKAQNPGIITSQKFLNMKIEIINENQNLTNECVPMGCVNTLSNLNSIYQIRNGTFVTFYIIETQ